MQDIYKMQAEICKALAHPKRIEIIQALCGRELNASELLKTVRISKANMSQHMAKLTGKGIIKARKQGTSVFYSIADGRITKACGMMKQVLISGLEEKNRILKRAKSNIK